MPIDPPLKYILRYGDTVPILIAIIQHNTDRIASSQVGRTVLIDVDVELFTVYSTRYFLL
jgi:hypothetical protein